MSWLSISDMNNYTCQVIVKCWEVLRMLLRGLLPIKMLQRVVINIQLHGKLMPWSDFLINERVQIEHNSLQMNNQHLRKFRDPSHFRNITLVFAEIASIVINHLPKGVTTERLREIFRVLYLQGNRVKVLFYFFCFFAIVTLE